MSVTRQDRWQRWLQLTSVVLAVLVISSCGESEGPSTGTHIGNPGDLEFRVSSALTEASGGKAIEFVDPAGVSFTLLEARVVIREIELYLPSGLTCASIAGSYSGARCEAGDDKLQVDGPFVVDLLTGAASPSLESVKVPPLLWRRLDYRIDDARDGLVPIDDALSGHSLSARARFELNDAPTELQLRLRFNEVARVEAPGGVQLPERGRLLVDFDAAAWLEQAPITSCITSGDLAVVDGVLRLEDDADDDDNNDDLDDIDDSDDPDGKAEGCAGLEGVIRDSIEGSAQLKAE